MNDVHNGNDASSDSDDDSNNLEFSFYTKDQDRNKHIHTHWCCLTISQQLMFSLINLSWKISATQSLLLISTSLQVWQL